MALILRLRTTVARQTSSEMSQTQPSAPIGGQTVRRITLKGVSWFIVALEMLWVVRSHQGGQDLGAGIGRKLREGPHPAFGHCAQEGAGPHASWPGLSD